MLTCAVLMARHNANKGWLDLRSPLWDGSYQLGNTEGYVKRTHAHTTPPAFTKLTLEGLYRVDRVDGVGSQAPPTVYC